MTSLLRPPIQSQSLVDKDGKPTSHQYRWMDGITENVSSIQTTVTNNFANVTGTAPLYYCRAWVNFNGTGTIAIRSSGNVSSLTDNGVGYYTVNLTTALPDTNYATVNSSMVYPSVSDLTAIQSRPKTTSSVDVYAVYKTGTSSSSYATYDPEIVQVAVFR